MFASSVSNTMLNSEEWSEQLREMEGLQEKLDDDDEIHLRDLQRHERAARKIDDRIVEECKELLELFGIPFLTSPGVSAP